MAETVIKPNNLIRMIERIKTFFFSKYDIYFYQELFPNYIFGILFFTFILMLNELFYLAKLYIQYSVPLYQVFLLLLNMIPFLMSYSIPIGILPAYLLTMGRFSQDSELVALKSCGTSVPRIIRPGIVFGIIVSILAVFFMDGVVIPANITWIKLKARVMSQKPAVELKENDMVQLGGYKISFQKMVKENNSDVLYQIHMIDIQTRKTIEAEKGRFYIDPENSEHYIMKFMNGTISEVVNKTATNQTDEKFFVTAFRYLSVHCYIDMPQEYYQKGPESMTIGEITKEIQIRSRDPLVKIETYLKNKDQLEKDIQKIQDDYKVQIKGLDQNLIRQKALEMETRIKLIKNDIKGIDNNLNGYRRELPAVYIMKFYEKFALPLASLVFALLCLSIGMFSARSGRNEGLGLSIIIFLMYYGMKIGAEQLIMKQTLPPIMEWFPDIFFFTGGVTLMIMKIRE